MLIANLYYEKMVATLSPLLSWSHFIELIRFKKTTSPQIDLGKLNDYAVNHDLQACARSSVG